MMDNPTNDSEQFNAKKLREKISQFTAQEGSRHWNYDMHGVDTHSIPATSLIDHAEFKSLIANLSPEQKIAVFDEVNEFHYSVWHYLTLERNRDLIELALEGITRDQKIEAFSRHGYTCGSLWDSIAKLPTELMVNELEILSSDQKIRALRREALEKIADIKDPELFKRAIEGLTPEQKLTTFKGDCYNDTLWPEI